MADRAPLLHVLNGHYGNAMILDKYINGQRQLLILDGGPSLAESPYAELGISTATLFNRSLVSLARAVWAKGSIEQSGQLPFKPTAIVSLEHQDPYESLLALLDSYKGQSVPDPSSAFAGPLILPNPVNISDGWKAPHAVRGRHTVISEVLKSWKFDTDDTPGLVASLSEINFHLPPAEKMLCYTRTPDVRDSSIVRQENTEPQPNGQSVLLSSSEPNGRRILLATRTSDYRVITDGLEDQTSPLSIYQISNSTFRGIQDPEAHLPIAKEFALWTLMEFGYKQLNLTSEQEKELPAFNICSELDITIQDESEIDTETAKLGPLLYCSVAKMGIRDNSPVPESLWSDVHLPVHTQWLNQLDRNAGLIQSSAQRVLYLASILRITVELFAAGSNPSLNCRDLLRALRLRQAVYLRRCVTSTKQVLTPIDDSVLPLDHHLPCSVNDLFQGMERNLRELCLLDSRNELSIYASLPVRYGLFHVGLNVDGSFEAHPKLWRSWMDPKYGGHILDFLQCYSEIVATAVSIKFYSTCSADLYFVSPEGSENSCGELHGSEVLGLMLAALIWNPSHQATLFLPSTRRLNFLTVAMIAKMFDVEHVFEDATISTRRSMPWKIYSTLEGLDTGLTEADRSRKFPDFRDVKTGESETLTSDERHAPIIEGLPYDLSLTSLTSVDLDLIHDQSTDFYSFRCLVSDTTANFFIAVDSSVLSIGPMQEQNPVYRPPFKIASKEFKNALRAVDAYDDDIGWHLAIFGPSHHLGGAYIPYRTMSRPNSEGLWSLRIEYPGGSQRYFAFCEYLVLSQNTDHHVQIVQFRSTNDLTSRGLKELVFGVETKDNQKLGTRLATDENREAKQSFTNFGIPKLLSNRKVEDEELNDSTVVLGGLLKWNLQSLIPYLYNKLRAFAHLLPDRLDMERSMVFTQCTALETFQPYKAELYPTTTPDESCIELSPGLRLRRADVKVSLEPLSSPRAILTFATNGDFIADSGRTYSLIASSSIAFGEDPEETIFMSLRFSDSTPTLDELKRKLALTAFEGADSIIMDNALPFCKSSLRDLLAKGDVKVTELVFALDLRIVSEIHLETRVTEWQEILPDSLDLHNARFGQDFVFTIKVRYPSTGTNAQIAVTINFQAAIRTSNEANAKVMAVPLILSATPLILPDDFEYRLTYASNKKRLDPDSADITFVQLLSGISGSATWERIYADVPMAEYQLVHSVIRTLSFRLLRTSTTYSIDGFEMDSHLESLTFMARGSGNAFELSDARMHLQTLYGVVKCDAVGVVWVRGNPLPAQVRLPQRNLPGFVTLKHITGVSLSHFRSMHSLTSLPLAKLISEPMLDTVQFQFSTHDPNNSTPINLSGVNFKLQPHEPVSLSNLPPFQGVQGSLSFKTRDQEAQLLLQVSGDTIDKRFTIAVETAENPNNVSVTLYPTHDISCTEVLTVLLGKTARTVYSDVIDLLPVDNAFILGVSMSSDLRSRRCVVNLTPRAPVLIGRAKVFGVRFECDISVTEGNVVQFENAVLRWDEQVKGCAGLFTISLHAGTADKFSLSCKASDKNDFTALGFLDRFSIPHDASAVPPGGLEKAHMDISELQADLSTKSGCASFNIDSVRIRIEMPAQNSLSLLSLPKVEVDHVTFSWNSGDETLSKANGYRGLIKFLPGLDVPVSLVRNHEGEIYEGHFTAKSEAVPIQETGGVASDTGILQRPLELHEVANKLLPEAIELSPELNIPKPLEISSGIVYFNRMESALVRLRLIPKAWEYQLGGSKAQLVELEALIGVTQGQKSWKASLMATGTFGNFVAAQVALELCKSRRPLLTARLSKVTGNAAICGTEGNKDDIANLVLSVSSESTFWNAIRPKDKPEMLLDIHLGMYVGLDTSCTVFAGSINDIGQVVIFGRRKSAADTKSEPKSDFLVVLGISDPAKLWKNTSEICKSFNLQSITAQFSSADWEESDLKSIAEDAEQASKNLLDMSTPGPPAESTVIAANSLAAASPLLALKPGQSKIKKGAELRAIISLTGDKEMTQTMKSGVEKGKIPSITLSARMSDPETIFRFSISELTFLEGAIVLKKCEGTFTPHKGKASNTPGLNTINLEAELDFKILKTNVLLGLSAKVELTSEASNFDVNLENVDKKRIDIPNPLGEPFGLVLEMAALKGKIDSKDKTKTSIQLKGALAIGKYNFIAEVLFYAGKPKVFQVDIGKSDISFEELANGLVHHGLDNKELENWPTDSYPPLSLYGGCFYYCNTKEGDPVLGDPNETGMEYHPGFNINVALHFFSATAFVLAHVYPDRSGIKLAGHFSMPIQIAFLKLASAQSGKPDCGPEFLMVWRKEKGKGASDPYQIGQSRFEMLTTVSLFDKLTFTVQLITQSGKGIRGQHTPVRAIDGIGSPKSTITVTYENKSWYINGVDVEKAWDNLDLARAIKQASYSDRMKDCGELVDLFFDQVIRMKFKFRLDFNFKTDDDGAPKEGIYACIGAKVLIVLATTGESLDEIELPNVDPRVITRMQTADDLFIWLEDVAQSLLDSIAHFLFEHPDQFKKLLEWMLAKDWTKALINTLLCRGIDPNNVKDRHRELEPPPQPQQPPAPSHEDKHECPDDFWHQLECSLGSALPLIASGLGSTSRKG